MIGAATRYSREHSASSVKQFAQKIISDSVHQVQNEDKPLKRNAVAGEDENVERGNWTGKLDFILSCLGYAVGLGNVWRFPYLAYEHGGAIFLIPYCFSLLLIGLPLFFLELSLGQFTSSGPLTSWKMAPFFQGLGACMLVVTSILAIYYNMIIGWAIYYLFASFAALPSLPWTACNANWATPYCDTFVDASIVNSWSCANYVGNRHAQALYVPFPNGVCVGLRPSANVDGWFVASGENTSDEARSVGTFKARGGASVVWSSTYYGQFKADIDQAYQEQTRRRAEAKQRGSLSSCRARKMVQLNNPPIDSIFREHATVPRPAFSDSNYMTGVVGFWNTTLTKKYEIVKTGPSVEYFYNRVLRFDESDGMCNLGKVHWDLALCLAFAWLIVFVCLMKGIKTSGKVVYFTALFPYFLLFILMIVGALQEGSLDGVLFYLRGYGQRPEDQPTASGYSSLSQFYMKKLSNIDVLLKHHFGLLTQKDHHKRCLMVWKVAAEQIFFSLSTCYGGLIALASYNRFHNPCLRDSLIVAFGNCLTSFFAGFVIFSFLGALAKTLDVSVSEVTDSGIGLAFVVYPNAVTKIPPAPLWSILFFVMLLTLGLDSEFALVETLLTSICDFYPGSRRYKTYVIAALCCVLYWCGFSMATSGGLYMLNLLDTFGAGWNVLLLAFLECVCVGIVYGHRNSFTRFTQDISTMLGKDATCMCIPWRYQRWIWMSMWCLVTPLICIILFVYALVSFINKGEITVGGYVYEQPFVVLGWLISVLIFLLFILGAVESIVRHRTNWKNVFRPTREWGPALAQHRELCTDYCDIIIQPKPSPVSKRRGTFGAPQF